VILVYTNDSTHSADCIKNCYQDNDIIIARLDEPLSEKEKTFKAEASVLCDSLASFNYGNSIFQFCSKKILLIDKPILFQTPGNKIAVDAIIISKNPKLKLPISLLSLIVIIGYLTLPMPVGILLNGKKNATI
jgi:hypothetical protein